VVLKLGVGGAGGAGGIPIQSPCLLGHCGSARKDSYQEDFVIPGIWPLWASSRRQMRHTPNFR